MAKRKYDADSIRSITDDRDKVRERPTLYIPSTDAKGALHIFVEILDNSVDELKEKDAVGDRIDVSFDIGTQEFCCVDDGSGIPLEKLLDVCTVLNTSGKFANGQETSAYTNSGGTNGIGLKLAVFVSEYCEVISTRGGLRKTLSFKDGRLESENTEKVSKKLHGCSVRFKLLNQYVDVESVTKEHLISRCSEKSLIYPHIHINLNIVENGKSIYTHEFYNKSIVDAVLDMEPTTDIVKVSGKKTVTVVTKVKDSEPKDVEIKVVAVFGLKNEALDAEKDSYIVSYCNSIKTYSGGTNVEGLKDGLVKFFNNNVIPNLGKRDKDLKIVPADITAGLCGIIAVELNEPEFEGQHKDRINNASIKIAARDIICEALENESKTIVKEFSDFVKGVARGRLAAKKVRKKDVSSAFSPDRNPKLVDMIHNQHTVDPELIIVEGDSAGGNLSKRDYYNQAIFPVKRPANIFDEDSDSLDRSAVNAFNQILDYIGVQPGKRCRVEDCTVNRILTLTDGDTDGDIISDTVISLFAKHCKPLLDAGMIGRILPPLYSFRIGKNTQYVRSQREFYRLIMREFIKNVKIKLKGEELKKKEVGQLIQNNFDYLEKLGRLNKKRFCGERFLEFVVWNYSASSMQNPDDELEYWKKVLKKKFGSEVSASKEDGHVTIKGDAFGQFVLLDLDRRFEHQVIDFKSYQAQNDVIEGFNINGEDGTLYDVMLHFDKYKPADIVRIKGLGEIDGDELGPLCLDKKSREVIIFKFDDVDTDMHKISVIMSTMKQYAAERAELLRNMRADRLDIDT